MLAKLYSYGITGLDSYPVCIEVDVSRGFPITTIVGLPDNAIKESKERVRSAIKNSGHEFPLGRITVNLSPADTKKEGPAFDLPIALGVLVATGQMVPSFLHEYAIIGELSLDGQIKPIHGSLAIALAIDPNRFKGLLLPFDNAAEAAITNRVNIYPVKTLNEVVQFFSNPDAVTPISNPPLPTIQQTTPSDLDFRDVKGQTHAKRGLEIAAAGGHNVLMIGPPGSGKSMLAKRLPGILPDMTIDEALETTKIHSVMGLLKRNQYIVTSRPFRSPHHTTSDVAIIGGGSHPRPGEITLSHNGILFLDELPEFDRNVLETLRQPLEDHWVTIARATRTARFPAKVMLICAMNPCMCGQYGNPKVPCRCNTTQIQRYRSKISGPLLDRIDIHLDVPAVQYSELSANTSSETSIQIKERVNQARATQKERFQHSETICNAQMTHKQTRKFCSLQKEENDLLKMAMNELNLSARAYDKILKISRTIADLDGSIEIKVEHLAEAIQYRSLDRNFFA